MTDRANVAATFHRRQVDDPRFGYTQGDGRWGSGPIEWWECEGVSAPFSVGDRDCSSSVIDCWREALRGSSYEGALDAATYTGNMRAVFVGSGLFDWHPMWDGYIAKRGDVYLNEVNHTAMCQSAVPDMLSEYLSNEFGGIVGGQVGDQTSGESLMRAYYDFPWDGILAYNGKADGEGSSGGGNHPAVQGVPPIKYRVYSESQGWLPEMHDRHDTGGSADSYAGDGSPILYLAMDFPGWYRVCTERQGWLPSVTHYNIDDLEYGCAGDGSPITMVQCYYETPDPGATGYIRIRYAAANVGCGFFAEMEDDIPDQYGDTHAGNGGRISAFYAYPIVV